MLHLFAHRLRLRELRGLPARVFRHRQHPREFFSWRTLESRVRCSIVCSRPPSPFASRGVQQRAQRSSLAKLRFTANRSTMLFRTHDLAAAAIENSYSSCIVFHGEHGTFGADKQENAVVGFGDRRVEASGGEQYRTGAGGGACMKKTLDYFRRLVKLAGKIPC